MSAADTLEQRLPVARLGLFKLAGAMATDNRGSAFVVAEILAALPVLDVPDELAAGALESLASLARVMAAEVRGEEALR